MSEPAYYVTDYDGSICKDKTDVSLDESQICEILNQQADEIERLRKEFYEEIETIAAAHDKNIEVFLARIERRRGVLEKIRTTVREPYVSADSQIVLVDKIAIAGLHPETKEKAK